MWNNPINPLPELSKLFLKCYCWIVMGRFYLNAIVLRYVPAILVCVLFTFQSTQGQIAGEGKSFTLAFPRLSPSVGGEVENIRLLVMGDPGTRVEFTKSATGAQQARTIGASGYLEYIIDTTDLMLPWAEGTFRRIMKIEAPDPVTVTALLDRGTASEAYGAITEKLLGTDYTSLSLPSGAKGTFVAVAAVEDNTSVTITPTVETRGGNLPGVPFTVLLNKGEVYQVLSIERSAIEINDDLSGTRVESDQPVAVWSGTTCAYLPQSVESCNPIIEQLPPHESLGRTYPFTRYPTEKSAYWKAVSVCGESRVTTEDILPAIDIRLSEGEVYDGEAYSEGVIESTEPLMVVHLARNLDPSGERLDSATGDATMSLVTPVSQMAKQHRFVVPTLAPRGTQLSVDWRHTVTVTRSSTSVTVQLDGTPMVFNGLFASASVNPGGHEVIATGPIGVKVHGRSYTDAYSYVPAPSVRRGELVAEEISQHICGDQYDTTIWIANVGGADVVVEDVDVTNGLQGVLLDPLPPFTVPVDDSIQIHIGFTDAVSGSDSGNIVLSQRVCRGRILLDLPIKLKPDRLEFTPPAGSLVRFPTAYPTTPQVDATITATNPNPWPVTIASAAITPSTVTLANPATLPMTLPPLSSRPIVLRYTALPDDRDVAGEVRFFTSNCPDTSLYGHNLSMVYRTVRLSEPPVPFLRCNPKETDTIDLFLINYNDAPLTLESGEVLGGGGEFILQSTYSYPLSVPGKDSVRFRVLYLPGPLGSRTASFRTVLEGSDTLEMPLRAENDLAEASLSVTRLDFGRVLCDTLTPRQVTIRNTGTLRLEGLRVELVEGGEFMLEKKGNDPPDPGDELTVEVIPISRPGREAYDTIRVIEPICGAELLIPVRSRCIAKGNLRIGFRSESGEIGRTVPVPIYLQSDPQSFAAGAPVELQMKLRFAADMLLPDENVISNGNASIAITSSTVEGRERVVELEITGRLNEDGVLGDLPMLVLLGSDYITSLKIEEFRFNFLNDVFEGTAESFDGRFTALGWCAVGSPRLVDAMGTFGLKVIPNPVKEEARIQVDLVEEGETELVLYNEEGREISRFPMDDALPGSWLLRLPTQDLPEGHYTLTLITPTQRAEEQVIVIR